MPPSTDRRPLWTPFTPLKPFKLKGKPQAMPIGSHISSHSPRWQRTDSGPSANSVGADVRPHSVRKWVLTDVIP
jgi:hypothetical protein